MKSLSLLMTFFIIANCSAPKITKQEEPLLLTAPKNKFLLEKNSLASSLNSLNRSTQFYTHYQLAKDASQKKPQKACIHYSFLAQQYDFPLQNLAHIRALQVCKNKTLTINKHILKEKPWLTSLIINTQLTKAIVTQNWEKASHYYIKKTPYASSRKEKLFFLKKSLQLAKKSRDQGAIYKAQNELFKFAPRLNPRPKKQNFLSIAYDYRKNRNFKKALEFYQSILKSSHFSIKKKFQALKGIRITHKLNLNKEKYLQASREMATFTTRLFHRNKKNKLWTRLYHDANIMLIRSLWTHNHITEAKKNLTTLAKKLYKKYPLNKIFWIRGRMAEEKKQYSAALKWFSFANNKIKPKHHTWKKLNWYKAWNLRKIKKYQQSSNVLKKLIDNSSSPTDSYRYQFWLAKNYKNLGDKQKAKETLQKLTQADVIGFYGLLAHRELKIPLPPLSTNRHIASTETSMLSPRIQNYTSWLISVGETDVAHFFLDHISQELRKKRGVDPTIWTEVFKLYAQAGQYLPLFQQLGKIPNETRNLILNQKPEIIFPTPFKKEIQKASQTHNISQELIYSIIRQESAFNPLARSHADAIGLMQILPSVAQHLSDDHSKKIPHHQLYNPQLNINLGSQLLKQLFDKYNNQFILAVASYNADEKAIAGWINSRFHGDPLEFIEDIPYEETKNYIKLVLRNMIFYQRIKNQHLPTDFPEWCLKNLHRFKS